MHLDFAAHLQMDGQGNYIVQSVADHCIGAAKVAKASALPAGLGESAFLAAKYHDIGKYTAAFQNYLKDAVQGKPVEKGSVIHSFTGVKLLLDRFHSSQNPYEQLTAELIAYAIGSHHGLFDCVDEELHSGFLHRKSHPDVQYEEAIHNLFENGGSEAELRKEFQNALEEITQVALKLVKQFYTDNPNNRDGSELPFYFGLLARTITSAVMEGDRQDTAIFLSGLMPPNFSDDMTATWNKCLKNVESKLQLFPQDSGIAKARTQISQLCAKAAAHSCGVFRLNVPTGAGKTLSSLRFALAHAEKWKKSRIIFTSPLLSILEQNAAVIRKFIENDGLVLEHHSDVIKQDRPGVYSDTGKDLELTYLEDSWASPVIITTLVQLLNTMFSGKSSSVRRFHSLCDSVIVIDEVQTVPMKMLSLFNLAVNYLTVVCNASVVLCSATQPCLEETCHPIQVPVRDIVPYDEALWAPFQRTSLLDGGRYRLEEIPALATQIMEDASSLLIVCNKKDQARKLFQELSSGPWECIHLSAAMCPGHRKDAINRVKNCLGKKPIICVSTQVIEAGVDISFQRVIRFIAGMDNAIQAAGRCNRNGESQSIQPVYLVNCTDEKLGKLPEIQIEKTASIELLNRFQRNSASYGDCLDSNSAIQDYYRSLYEHLPSQYQDFSVEKTSLYSLLSTNRPPQENMECAYILNQAFSQAGKLFQVFEQDTTAVLCPYGEGEALIAELNSSRAERDLGYTKQVLERAKPFFVNLYAYQVEALQKNGGLSIDHWKRVYILNHAYYHSDIGFSVESPQNQYLEV